MRDTLHKFSTELTKHRVLNTAEAAAFCGYSVQHWRAMYRDGRAPAPIKLSSRKFGWQAMTLIAWLDAK